MVAETYDVNQFFSSHPLLGEISAKNRSKLLQHTQISFSRTGNKIEYDPDQIPGLLVLRSGSIEIRSSSGELYDRFSVDDLVLADDLQADKNFHFEIITLEDSLYYEIDAKTFAQACKKEELLAHFRDGWRRRFLFSEQNNSKKTKKTSKDNIEKFHSLLPSWNIDETKTQNFATLAQHMQTPIISVSPDTSIADAAKIMQQSGISALLICEGTDLRGIVTDKDFRNRVLATGLSPKKKVKTVMTPSPLTLPSSSKLHEARLLMMTQNIRHLVVTKKGKPAGMISANDLFKAENLEPLPLMGRINKADSVDELVDISKMLPELIAKLIRRNTRPSEIGEVITAFTDGLTCRLIVLAEEKFGKAPCDYAWLAFGSQARQEQVLGSDQDNGLIFGMDLTAKTDKYFAKLAKFVNDGLNLCGIVHCPGNIMASNPKWRMTLGQWKNRFDEWVEQPDPKSLMHASIFFDMRVIYGNAALQKDLQKHFLNKSRKNTIFHAHMTGNSLQHRTPMGFFKNFVLEHNGEHANELDLKKRGTIPIVDIARNYSLAYGITAVNTVERLDQIRECKALSADIVDSLIDAHEFIAQLRLSSQAEEFRQRRKVDNYLNPREISPLQRHQLKEAFQTVKESQHIMQVRFYSGLQ